MIYDFNLQEPYKTFLINGEKTIEGRLNKGKFITMKEGDVLQLSTGEQFLIEKITQHKTFLEMIKEFGKENIIPDAIDDTAANNIYYNFYTPEDEEKFGVLGLHIRILTKPKNNKLAKNNHYLNIFI